MNKKEKALKAVYAFMKIFVLILISLPFHVFGQRAQHEVFKWRAFETAKMNPENLELPKIEDWKDIDLPVLVTLNYNKLKIEIYTSLKQNFDIVGREENPDNDKYVSLTYVCVDDQGNKCKIDFQIFKHRDSVNRNWIANMFVHYSDVIYFYHLSES